MHGSRFEAGPPPGTQVQAAGFVMLKHFHSALGLMLAAFIGLSLLFTPMAAAQHIDQPAADICAAEFEGVHADDDEAGHEGHLHQGHGCGACHVHIVIPGTPPAVAACETPDLVRPLSSSVCGASAPRELFRPPRI